VGSKSQKPLGFSKTVGVGLVDPGPTRQPGRVLGRPMMTPVSQGRQPLPSRWVDEPATFAYGAPEEAGRLPLRRLVAEWKLELRVTGRSPRTIHWYLQKMDQLLRTARLESLDELSALTFKHFIAGEPDRGLAGNTVHGYFEVVKAFANWDIERFAENPRPLDLRHGHALRAPRPRPERRKGSRLRNGAT
jgi:hypothetical protein